MTWCYYCRKKYKKVYVCSACKYVTYCSIKCQKKDWKKHKETCNKFIYTSTDICYFNKIFDINPISVEYEYEYIYDGAYGIMEKEKKKMNDINIYKYLRKVNKKKYTFKDRLIIDNKHKYELNEICFTHRKISKNKYHFELEFESSNRDYSLMEFNTYIGYIIVEEDIDENERVQYMHDNDDNKYICEIKLIGLCRNYTITVPLLFME